MLKLTWFRVAGKGERLSDGAEAICVRLDRKQCRVSVSLAVELHGLRVGVNSLCSAYLV